MKLIAERAVWLAHPASFVEMNFDNPTDVLNRCNMLDMTQDMTPYKWVRLGTATVNMTIEATVEQLTADASSAIIAKVQELQEQHAAQIAVLHEALGKLQALTYTPKGE